MAKETIRMNCSICHHDESAVIRTEPAGETIRRRRECCRCKHRWTTYESSEDAAARLAELKSVLAPVAELVK